MEYLSYGHECVIYIVLLLVICHLILDVLPVWFKRARLLLASVPVRITGGLFIIIISFFLL
ncbi:hypothetical protein [Geomonas subterranea]|uniref:DUF3307 domain-containing protein n=1 Tax=Geomonas subterranea TaxID=2847989 RepID=A0ABX8LNT5_9BACT|nr:MULTISPECIES: hypothetical protein [Geomonas]QXE91913.1 hypothetical protein KP001_05090 [Geomonas subterranea]QXM09996.1 hypothetical protein KP002_02405 [Geomonas subterranea]